MYTEVNVMKKLTLDSQVKDLYETVIGHDALAKVLLQLNISEKAITNPLVGSLKLKTLASLTTTLTKYLKLLCLSA